MTLTMYVSTSTNRSPEISVKGQTGERIQVQWSKVYFKGLKNLVNETRCQYLNSKLPQWKLVYIAIRTQFLLSARNPGLAIRELLVGFEGRMEGQPAFPIELIHQGLNDEGLFWISRSGISQGIKSKVYGPEIDWDRIRFSRVFKFFIWGLNQPAEQRKTITPRFELSRVPVKIAPRKNIESLEAMDDFQFIRLLDCFVYNGIFTMKEKTVFLTDSSHAIEPTAWPTNKVGLFEGNPVVIEANETVSPGLPNAIFLGSSTSWYHFLVEIFPRFLCLVDSTTSRWTVITRGSLPKSILQLLEEIGFDKVQSLHDGQRIEVKELITIEDFRFGNALALEERTSDIYLIRNFFETKYDINDSSGMYYLKRSSHLFRPLYAQRKVEKFLVSMGFQVLLPEELDFHSQIQILGKAKVLVAASGAALTSMLFVPKHCKIVEIHNGEDLTDFWERFSRIIGLNLTVIRGRPFRFYNLITGAGLYRINLKQFKSRIREIVIN